MISVGTFSANNHHHDFVDCRDYFVHHNCWHCYWVVADTNRLYDYLDLIDYSIVVVAVADDFRHSYYLVDFAGDYDSHQIQFDCPDSSYCSRPLLNLIKKKTNGY